MTLLHEDVEAKKFDVRMIERNIARGAVSAADAEKVLKNLPDDAESADWVTLASLENQGATSSSGSAPTQH